MAATISVLVPTINRHTLARTLNSCKGADEVLTDLNDDGDHGYAARNRLMARATGTHLAFMDDDDVYAAGALEHMRGYATDRLVIFQMQFAHAGGTILWNAQELRYGQVGTPMLLVPNDPRLHDAWAGHEHTGQGGDYVFARAAADLLGPPVWVEHVVAIVRPQ